MRLVMVVLPWSSAYGSLRDLVRTRGLSYRRHMSSRRRSKHISHEGDRVLSSNKRIRLWSLAITAAILVGSTSARAQAPRERGRSGLQVEQITEAWTGDLDGMMQRRLIRILTVYSKTLYFVDAGVPRGTAYDQGKLLEEALNKKLRPGQLKVSVQFVPVSRDELLPWLVQGRGDIVMANLTVTAERRQTVDFTESWL